MTPIEFRKRSIQLSVLYIIAVFIGYWLSASFRELVQNYWLWFLLVPTILLLLAIFAKTRLIDNTLRLVTPAKLRKWSLWLAGIYVAVVVVLFIVNEDLRLYFQEHWLRTAIPLIILLIIAWLAQPRGLDKLLQITVPGRLRIWSLQIAVLYVVVVLVLYAINWPAREFIQLNWGWFLAVLAVLLFFAFLARPRGLELYREYPEPDEQETIDKIIDLFIGQLKKLYDNRLVLRDTHPKSNGLLFCKFEVLRDLPNEYRVGLFAEPKTYNCWMRFSNSEPMVTPDHDVDFRGIALKLFEVPGDNLQDDENGTHDFLFIAHDAFFAANPKDFFSFFFHIFTYGPRIGRPLYFIPLRLRLLWNALIGRRSYGHPFEIIWFSCAPFKFGDRVVKYKLFSKWPKSEPDRGDPDYLRKRLAETLKTQSHTMDFMVQFQEDPNRDLIETTAKPWRIPTFRTVARLHIPKQKFDSPDHLQFDENMTFNPWHCLPDHRPVGGINRARRDVMRAIQEFRLAQNGRQRTNVNKDIPDDAPPEAR